MERRPTIRDVARAAGVGASTVSLALRNDPRLRPAMREHVRKVAQEIGYFPNATLASLMAHLRAGRTARFEATLGFINASEDPIILREFSTFREWVRGATERARELGYGMDPFWLHEPGITAKRLGEILQARGIRGLIVAGMQNDGTLPASHVDFWNSFTSVVIGMRPKSPSLHFTSNDQFLTSREATEELRKLGYKRIGLVIDERIDRWLEQRFSAGFFSQSPMKEQVFAPVFDFRKTAFESFKEWCLTNNPDAIITLHREVEDWLEALRLKTPRDLGVIHLDWEEGMNGWAGMNQNNYRVGASATDMVVGALHRNELGVPDFPRSSMMQSIWVNGASVQPQECAQPRAKRRLSKAR